MNLKFSLLPQQSPRPERKSESSGPAVTLEVKDTKQLFHKNTKAIIWGMQTRAVQVCAFDIEFVMTCNHYECWRLILLLRKIKGYMFASWPLSEGTKAGEEGNILFPLEIQGYRWPIEYKKIRELVRNNQAYMWQS